MDRRGVAEVVLVIRHIFLGTFVRSYSKKASELEGTLFL